MTLGTIFSVIGHLLNTSFIGEGGGGRYAIVSTKYNGDGGVYICV